MQAFPTSRITAALLVIMAFLPVANATNYFIDCTAGNDNNTGTSPSEAWKTTKQLRAVFGAGDQILFKAGCSFRTGILNIDMGASGGAGNPIKIGSYGAGASPVLFGSSERSATNKWAGAGVNIWKTGGLPDSSSTELLTYYTFNGATTGYYTYFEANASGSAGIFAGDCISDQCYAINISYDGTYENKIQFYTDNNNRFQVDNGSFYILSFYAKANNTAVIEGDNIKLMQDGGGYTAYYSDVWLNDLNITPTWTKYQVIFLSNQSSSQGAIRFYLGRTTPNSTQILIDNLSVKVADSLDYLAYDVGHICFNNGQYYGIKNWSQTLKNDLEYYYNATDWTLYLYSNTNPGTRFNSVELALKNHIIDLSSDDNFIIQNISLKHGGAHGIRLSQSDNIIIRNLNISNIGGGRQSGNIRYGNGIEFWSDTQNVLVYDNYIEQVYDAALTHQANPLTLAQNITFLNNTVRTSEYCFEHFAAGTNHYVNDLYFINNSCINIGRGWAASQRPDPRGYCFQFYANTATINNLVVGNNSCINPLYGGINIDPVFTGVNNFTLNNNYYHQVDSDNWHRWNNTYFFWSTNITNLTNASIDGKSFFIDSYYYMFLFVNPLVLPLPDNFSNNQTILEYYFSTHLNSLVNGKIPELTNTDFGNGRVSARYGQTHIFANMNNTGWWNGTPKNLPPQSLYAKLENTIYVFYNDNNAGSWVRTPDYIYLYPKNGQTITFNFPEDTYKVYKFYGDDSENGLRLERNEIKPFNSIITKNSLLLRRYEVKHHTVRFVESLAIPLMIGAFVTLFVLIAIGRGNEA